MIKVLKRLQKRDWFLLLLGVAFIVMQVGIDLKIPDYMTEITTLVQTPGSAMADIWKAGGMMLLCAVGSLLCMVIVGFCMAKVSASLSKRMRSLLFDKVSSFSMGETNRFSTSSLITRATNDVTQIQVFIAMGLQSMVKAPVMAVWAMSKISGKGAEWSAVTLVAVLIMTILVLFILLFVMPKFKKTQMLTDDLNRVVMENLDGLRVVRAYNAEGFQEDKFEDVNHKLTKINLFTTRSMSVMMPIISSVLSGLTLAIYWIGAILINKAELQEQLTLFSNMVVFSSYAVQVVMSFLMLVIVFILLPRAAVSAKRINEVLAVKPSVAYGEETGKKASAQGEIVFDNVSFKYPDAAEYVLHNISFSAKQGETIAFIGSTGSGKSTLINLIPRFFDPTDGKILINNIDIKEYEQEILYNKIGYVPQKAVMFSGNVSTNVAYGNGSQAEYTEEEIKTAIEIAQATDFVEKMDGTYNAPIARGGTNISGGQKQRLAIARAVCRKPEIYIFDDSFSALDYKTDRVLRAALKEKTAGITSVIVAQRIGTIMNADQIIVLDEGKMVGHGKHNELMKNCEVYKQIAKSQLSEEELAS